MWKCLVVADTLPRFFAFEQQAMYDGMTEPISTDIPICRNVPNCPAVRTGRNPRYPINHTKDCWISNENQVWYIRCSSTGKQKLRIRNRYDFDILTLGTSKLSFIGSIKRLKEKHGDRAELRIQFRCFRVFVSATNLIRSRLTNRKDYVRTRNATSRIRPW